jgi:hypothetical protein
MKKKYWKGMLTGVAGGLVAWWAIDRFYRLARASSSSHGLVPYCLGAGAGVTYGALVLARHPRPIARVPLGAAVYLANPERTALPKGGRGISKKTANLALRLASKGLEKVTEMALRA